MERLWPAAREAGFTGLAAFPFTEFSAWLETLSGRPGYEEFPSWRGLANARESLPTARSVVVAAWDYSKIPVLPLTGKVARLYLTFSDPPDPASHPGGRRLLEAFARLGWKATTKVPRREAAVAAGLLVQRRNCLGYLPRGHSFVSLFAWAVDAEVEPARAVRGGDADGDSVEQLSGFTYPPARQDPCGGCRKCLDACPTGALASPFVLDPRRCIDRNTWRIGEGIPRELRPKLGSWIYGCDVCQQACPHNHGAGPVVGTRDDADTDVRAGVGPGADPERVLEYLATVDEESFRKSWSRLFVYNPNRNDVRRNAIVALGNVGGTRAEPTLLGLLSDEDPVIRGHAAWALGRLGTASARRALERACQRETDSLARREIRLSLEEETNGATPWMPTGASRLRRNRPTTSR